MNRLTKKLNKMNNIKRYSRRVRKIIEKNWNQIRYLFENEKLGEKKDKYLKALESGNSHTESLIYAYTEIKKKEIKKENIENYMYTMDNFLYKIGDMEFLGEVYDLLEYKFCYNNGYEKIIRYFYHEEAGDIVKIAFKYDENGVNFSREWSILSQTEKDGMINDFINEDREDLAIKLYNRFLEKEKNDIIKTTSI